MDKKFLTLVVVLMVVMSSFIFLPKNSAKAINIDCSVTPSRQVIERGQSGSYTIKNNSSDAVWAAVTVNSGDATLSSLPSGTINRPTSGKISIGAGGSATFSVGVPMLVYSGASPEARPNQIVDVTCSNTGNESLFAGTDIWQSKTAYFDIPGKENTCTIGLSRSPNGYSIVNPGENNFFTFGYQGSPGAVITVEPSPDIKGITFVPPKTSPENGKEFRVDVNVSSSAPIAQYSKGSPFSKPPLIVKCTVGDYSSSVEISSIEVVSYPIKGITEGTSIGNFKAILSPNPDGITVKKGDKLKYNLSVTHSGGWSGKVNVNLFDVPPGIKATLNMASSNMVGGSGVAGTVELEVVGRVPSSPNKFTIRASGENIYNCGAQGVASCAFNSLIDNSTNFYITGTDSNYGTKSVPVVVNSIEPSVLKRKKVLASGYYQENQGFLTMSVVYGQTPFIVTDERSSAICRTTSNISDKKNATDPLKSLCDAPGTFEQWWVSKISLADPLNPSFRERKVYAADIAGDDGGHHEPLSTGMSRDGTFSIGSHHQGLMAAASRKEPAFGSFNKARPGAVDPTSSLFWLFGALRGGDRINSFFVVDSSSDTFLIGNQTFSGSYINQLSDYQLLKTTRLGSNYISYVPAKLPQNAPTVDENFVQSAPIRAIDGESSDYVASLDSEGKNKDPKLNPNLRADDSRFVKSRLSIYSLERKNPIATKIVPGLNELNGRSVLINGFETPTGKYAFIAARAITPESSASKSNYNAVLYENPRTFYLYKLDEAGKKIDAIIEKGTLGDKGEILDVTPIHVSGKDFIMVFSSLLDNNTLIPGDDRDGLTSRVVTISIYSFDDLKQGKVRNIASSSIRYMRFIKQAESLIKGEDTYVYTIDKRGAFLVWKFDKQSLSESGVTAQPPTGVTPVTFPGSGGTPVYPTPPTTGVDPNCPNGTVYETSAGKLCVTTSGGVTTTTEYNYNPSAVVPSLGAKSQTSSTYNFGTTTLKNGSTGEAVKELQRFLNNKLNLGLVVDGKLGPKTITVIKKWQSDNGLVSDGLVGAKTKALMNAVGQ